MARNRRLTRSRLRKKAQIICNDYDLLFSTLTEQELLKHGDDLKEQAMNGTPLDVLLPEAYALVREIADRTLHLRPFENQVMGAIALHQSSVIEMANGEGKTLTATMPAYLNSLSGQHIHIATYNDYLATRDAKWMGPLYMKLGLSVGILRPEWDKAYQLEQRGTNVALIPCSRKHAYTCNIVYGTHDDFIFDYLRDNRVQRAAHIVQGSLDYIIVDEADSVLIDRARTPLKIAEEVRYPSRMYLNLLNTARQLQPDEDYLLNPIQLTDQGIEKAQIILQEADFLQGHKLYSREAAGLAYQLIQSLLALHSYERDREYIVKDGQIITIDSYTGRLNPESIYPDGLHQAIQAKEEVDLTPERVPLAQISYQHFFKLYKKMAGMTGSALTEAEEFKQVYHLDVVVIPTHKPMIRKDLPYLIYKTEEGKFDAVAAEITGRHETKQPILVGTTSIEVSERLSEKLQRQGIEHSVLNAKFHEKEAHIVANAGRSGAVTIATNMAGRGTDILLGGNPSEFVESILREWDIDLDIATEEDRADALEEAKKRCEEDRKRVLRVEQLRACQTYEQHLQDIYTERKIDPDDATAEQRQKAEADAKKRYAKYMRLWEDEALRAKEIDPDTATPEQRKSVAKQAEQRRAEQYEEEWSLRGLHIIGTERHEARRIDNQLRGRAGRQGDPGSSRFHLSLQDDIMRRFGTDRVARLMDAVGMDDSMPIESGLASKFIEQAQSKVENYNFQERQRAYEFDSILDKQRKRIYAIRRKAVLGESLATEVATIIENIVLRSLKRYLKDRRQSRTWKTRELGEFFCSLSHHFQPGNFAGLKNHRWETIRDWLLNNLHRYYSEQKSGDQIINGAKMTEEERQDTMKSVEAMLFIQALDKGWIKHLKHLEELHQEMALRSQIEEDQLEWYTMKSNEAFWEMVEEIEVKFVSDFLRAQVTYTR